jgi:S-DNA-T family DNA segregation ATPase FtsK/SpoIIIE
MTLSTQKSLALGVLFMLVGTLLEVAFISHIFTGHDDQHIMDALPHMSLREVGRETQNILGVVGAVVSQVFVYRWFGIAALALPLIPFLVGWKLFFERELLPMVRTTQEVLFYTLWVSILMGYVVFMSETEHSLGFLSGGFGFAVNTFLFDLLRWGSVVIILLALFLFVLFFYGVTSFPRFSFTKNPAPSAADYPEEEAEEEVPVAADPRPSTPLSVQPEPPEAPVPYTPPAAPLPPPVEKKLELVVEVTSEPEHSLHDDTPQDDVHEQVLKEFGQYDPTLDLPHYQFPTLSLLTPPSGEASREKVTQEELESNKERIVETLGNYKINISQIKATIGPTVTLYEIVPEAGVRIAQIKNLEDDIALGLSALGIRIIAPMPGRGTIGIEVPNKNRETVMIRSVLGSERFQKANYDLPIVLGKTISNEILVVDLAKMPHLLMAGATGQGKSVGLNVILASLIYKKHPAQLKFVLVDPKKVELTLFNKIERHFLAKLPNSEEAIITDTKKVIYTLNSLCIEMDSRYDLLKEASVRNLKEYNAKFIQRKLNPERGHRFLPFIVLVIDELADLMMTAGKEVETPIARLAQLARAVGIHLVVATQRPSVKVITGLIKANFPARLSFKVTSSIDSRTILDTGGAEQLVGMGDMLLSINSELVRLQCPFVDTAEIEDICEFIGSQRGYEAAYALPEYEGDDAGDAKADIDTGSFDPLLSEAARLVVTHQQGSTSLIQRKMKLGYNRAGRIMDQLEQIGVVGAFTGSKARDVLFHDLSGLEAQLAAHGIG